MLPPQKSKKLQLRTHAVPLGVFASVGRCSAICCCTSDRNICAARFKRTFFSCTAQGPRSGSAVELSIRHYTDQSGHWAPCAP